MHSLCAFFNLIIGGYVSFRVGRNLYRDGSGVTWHARFLALCLKVPLNTILSCTPRPIKRRLWFGFRYLCKAVKHASHLATLRRNRTLPSKAIVLQRLRPNVQIDAATTKLTKFLHIDILSLISQHLHYVDLINLSMTSKAIRAVVFPSAEIGDHADQLRRYTCEDDNKSQCWTCGIQVCQVRMAGLC